jgi:predicted transcriptional regulator
MQASIRVFSIILIAFDRRMDTHVVTAHLPTELADKLDGLAQRLDRPKGWIVNEAIASYVALEEKRHRLAQEALGDVEAGRTFDHAEINAWAEGLDKAKRSRRR